MSEILACATMLFAIGFLGFGTGYCNNIQASNERLEAVAKITNCKDLCAETGVMSLKSYEGCTCNPRLPR